MSKITYIAASRQQPSSIVLAAEDHNDTNDIEVWNVESGERISRFHSILDGFRLALAYDQLSCVAGNYRQGVALYNINSCLEVWRRSDLRGLQFIQFAKEGQAVFCGFDNGPGQVLSADSGKTLRVWRGVRNLFESPCDSRVLLYKGNRGYAITGNQDVRDILIPSLKPGPLIDVAFSPRNLCLSEYTAVRCFNMTGMEVWRASLPPDEHMIKLSYQHKLGAYFGILSNLTTTETSLVKINCENGSYKTLSSLGRLQRGGFGGDSKVVCTNGTVWDLETGELVAQLWNNENSEPKSDLEFFGGEVVRDLGVRKLVDRLWGSNSPSG